MEFTKEKDMRQPDLSERPENPIATAIPAKRMR